jgi:phage terminase large subunit
MTNLTQSLRTLPPRQVLLLALQEKAKRRKMHLDSLAANSLPTISDHNSLVLDPKHPLYDLLHTKARNKVYWGGRGAAKTTGIAEALIRKASVEPIRVLCTREFQTTIKDSSHKTLKDMITRLKLDRWFSVTQEGIKSTAGAEFIFKGLYNNEAGIKGTEGIDICWVAEAQNVTATSWKNLAPTIRKPGSEIWVDYNLIDIDQPVHQRYVINGRPNSIVHKINYDSNPYFPAELREEMEADKAESQSMYEHIWLGEPLKIDNSIVYNGKYQELDFPDDLWKKADRLMFGLDFGFSQDPLAGLRMFELENCLYIEYEAYGTGIEIDEMPDYLKRCLPELEGWTVKADGSRPETISHLNRHGVACAGAEKWQGCVEDGVSHIKGYKKIYVHPRCVKTLAEFRNYRFKVDRITKEVLPIIVDKHNHSMDAMRYGHDGRIQRSGALGMWARLGNG